ncbi:MAG: cupredoxin domain-containing protein [Solirubrobacteraceae bacterium]
MRTRRGSFPSGSPSKHHILLAVVLGAGVAIVPAAASSETIQTVQATNGSGLYGEPHTWSPSQVSVMAGGVVKFSNPSNTIPHGLKFTGGSAGATPTCTGIPKEAEELSGAFHWQGECTFSKPGTYTFICTVHPAEMKGTITVNSDGTTTTTTTEPTAPTTTTTTPPTTQPPVEESPLAGPVSRALGLAKSQHGGAVRGSVSVSKAGAGGRLEVDLLAQSGLLAKAKHSARVRVGRLVLGSLSTGRVSFSVKLNARARRALARKHRLALTVRIVLTPPSGKALTITRAVVEHR